VTDTSAAPAVIQATPSPRKCGLVKIKAAVLYGPNEDLQIEQVDLADPLPGDVLVRIVGSGVCGSDAHALAGELPMYAGSFPMVLGHEAAGVVEAVGSDVRYVRPGITSCSAGTGVRPLRAMLERRPAALHATRLQRRAVRRQHPLSRDAGRSITWPYRWLCEYAVVGERTCVKIREDAPLEKVCLIGCACARATAPCSGTRRSSPAPQRL